MHLSEIIDRQLVASLRDNVCPACGKRKALAQTFCRTDYYRLTAARRQALYNRLGQGYREAVAAAFESLGIAEFVHPDGTVDQLQPEA